MANYCEGKRYRVVGDGSDYTYKDNFLNELEAEAYANSLSCHAHVEEYLHYHHEEGTDFLAP